MSRPAWYAYPFERECIRDSFTVTCRLDGDIQPEGVQPISIISLDEEYALFYWHHMCLTTDVGGSIPHMTHARMRVACAITQATHDGIGRCHLPLGLSPFEKRAQGYDMQAFIQAMLLVI